MKELRDEKRIDALDKAARKQRKMKNCINRQILKETSYIDHTLRDQRETMDQLWNSETFIKRLDDEQLLYDVHLRQRQTENDRDLSRFIRVLVIYSTG